MSNDVHLAKVSKVQRNTLTAATIPKGAQDKCNRRCNIPAKLKVGRGGTPYEGQQFDMNMQQTKMDESDNIFGSISPRGNIIKHNIAGDMDSPDHTQRDTNESDNNISSCSTLDIVNKIENLSVSSKLETQIKELSQRLQEAEQQHVEMQRLLEESNAEKELCCRRLEVVSAAHECRITEMHCVIAELSKKLRAKQDNTIVEEQELEGSEVSYQEGSIYNSELNLTNPDEVGTEEKYALNVEEDNLCGGELTDGLKFNNEINKGQVEALQEEILHLKAQIALLQSEISNSLRFDTEKVIEEEQHSIEYFDEDIDANDSNCSLEQLQFESKYHKDLNNLDATAEKDAVTAFKRCDAILSPQKDTPIPKMAERVKLRCANRIADVDVDATIDQVTATDLLNNELTNSEIVEHLVSEIKQNNSILENFADSSQLENEFQRLQRKVEHLKVRNNILTLTLDECKEHCEHLYLLCGKYESNAVALQMAVNCSDRAIEAYDVMLALLESNLVLMKDNSLSAEESRKAVESVARHLLDRLESEKDICENSLGPWQSAFNIPDKVCTPWTTEDDNRLRYHVSKLKGRRSTVQNTIVNLESPFSDFYEKSRLKIESNKELNSHEKPTQIDLEMAVLMQELLNLREENSTLKAKTDDIDRERQQAIDRVTILQEALKQLQLQLAFDSNTLFKHSSLENRAATEKRISYSESEHIALTEQQLVEALTRENELKGRIQTLVASVSATQKISDEKYEQLHNNIRDLQKTNHSLNHQLDQNKKKYQLRIRKLEQKMIEMSHELGRQIAIGDNVGQLQQMQFQLQAQRAKSKHLAAAKHLQNDNVPETTL